MPLHPNPPPERPTGHALRDLRLRQHSLERAAAAPPPAAAPLRPPPAPPPLTRPGLPRRSGVSRGTLRDIELGVHLPTRRTLRQLLTFYQRSGVPPERLEEVRRLYAGPGDTLGELIARLELRAGSPRELAR